MISIQKMRKLIPDGAQDLSDEELERVREDLYKLTNIAFDLWVREKKLKKLNPNTGVD